MTWLICALEERESKMVIINMIIKIQIHLLISKLIANLEERVTMPVLTKYERARVIGTRAQQIALNSPLMLDPGEEKDPYKIAELELSYGNILTDFWIYFTEFQPIII